MTYLVEIPVEGGGELRVQASEGDLAGALELAAVRPGEVVARARESLDRALDEVKPAIDTVVKKLRGMAPDEMSIEFGLVLTAESGAVIAKGGAEVHFTVALTWKRPDAAAQTTDDDGMATRFRETRPVISGGRSSCVDSRPGSWTLTYPN